MEEEHNSISHKPHIGMHLDRSQRVHQCEKDSRMGPFSARDPGRWKPDDRLDALSECVGSPFREGIDAVLMLESQQWTARLTSKGPMFQPDLVKRARTASRTRGSRTRGPLHRAGALTTAPVVLNKDFIHLSFRTSLKFL